jgi:hypothetical protein
MSALGQKQTYAAQKAMSALPPIATAKANIGKTRCLLYPRKRTCAAQQPMSATGQKRTCNATVAKRALDKFPAPFEHHVMDRCDLEPDCGEKGEYRASDHKREVIRCCEPSCADKPSEN